MIKIIFNIEEVPNGVQMFTTVEPDNPTIQETSKFMVLNELILKAISEHAATELNASQIIIAKKNVTEAMANRHRKG